MFCLNIPPEDLNHIQKCLALEGMDTNQYWMCFKLPKNFQTKIYASIEHKTFICPCDKHQTSLVQCAPDSNGETRAPDKEAATSVAPALQSAQLRQG